MSETMDRVQWGRMVGVLEEVRNERERQHAKWGQQDHPDTARSIGLADLLCMLRDAREVQVDDQHGWADVLLEEVCEALLTGEPRNREAELIQVAAVACQWVEAIRRRRIK